MGRIMMNGIQYGTGGRPTAEGVTYDNAESGMTAKNVQEAVDELNNGLMNGMKPVLLWEGDKIGSGSITISGLSDWFLIAIANYASDDYLLVGSPLRGGMLYGIYDSTGNATMGYRFDGSLDSDTITISSQNRGIYVGTATTYSSGTDCHIRRVYGLMKKPTRN